MRRLVKAIVNRTWKPLVKNYLRKPRIFTYKNISVNVPPGVFHPGFFFSTKLMISFLEQAEVTGKKILEMGSGSGLISIYLAKRNALVTTCDISPLAEKATTENAKRNNAPVAFFHSDLFSAIPPQHFDIIVVNPPFFKKEPASMEEKAWYCGENLDYFRKFFQQAGAFMRSDSQMFMVLSDECDIEGIAEIANENEFAFIQTYEKKTGWETGYIFFIRLIME
jgi:release factor glutamine methyltransferase